MRMSQHLMSFATAPREIKEITREIGDWVEAQGID